MAILEEPAKENYTQTSPRRFFLELLKEEDMIGWPEDGISDDWEIARIIAIGKKRGKEISYTMDSIFRSRKKSGNSPPAKLQWEFPL